MGSSSLRSRCNVATTICFCLSAFDIGFLSLPCDLIRLILTTSQENSMWPTTWRKLGMFVVVGHIEVSRDVVNVSLIKSQDSEKKPMSKTKRQRQVVVSTLQWLLKKLEPMNPHDDCYIFIWHFSYRGSYGQNCNTLLSKVLCLSHNTSLGGCYCYLIGHWPFSIFLTFTLYDHPLTLLVYLEITRKET